MIQLSKKNVYIPPHVTTEEKEEKVIIKKDEETLTKLELDWLKELQKNPYLLDLGNVPAKILSLFFLGTLTAYSDYLPPY